MLATHHALSLLDRPGAAAPVHASFAVSALDPVAARLPRRALQVMLTLVVASTVLAVALARPGTLDPTTQLRLLAATSWIHRAVLVGVPTIAIAELARTRFVGVDRRLLAGCVATIIVCAISMEASHDALMTLVARLLERDGAGSAPD